MGCPSRPLTAESLSIEQIRAYRALVATGPTAGIGRKTPRRSGRRPQPTCIDDSQRPPIRGLLLASWVKFIAWAVVVIEALQIPLGLIAWHYFDSDRCHANCSIGTAFVGLGAFAAWLMVQAPLIVLTVLALWYLWTSRAPQTR